MTCKEYDKIIKEFDNAIWAFIMMKESSFYITSPLYNINFDEEINKLKYSKQLFIEQNTRGK